MLKVAMYNQGSYVPELRDDEEAFDIDRTKRKFILLCNWRKAVAVSPKFQDKTFWQIENRVSSSHSTSKEWSVIASAAFNEDQKSKFQSLSSQITESISITKKLLVVKFIHQMMCAG